MQHSCLLLGTVLLFTTLQHTLQLWLSLPQFTPVAFATSYNWSQKSLTHIPHTNYILWCRLWDFIHFLSTGHVFILLVTKTQSSQYMAALLPSSRYQGTLNSAHRQSLHIQLLRVNPLNLFQPLINIYFRRSWWMQFIDLNTSWVGECAAILLLLYIAINFTI